MISLLKKVRVLVVCAALLCATSNNVYAFLPIPPMPGEPIAGLPSNVQKLIVNVQNQVAKVQAVYQKIQSIKVSGVAGMIPGASSLSGLTGGLSNGLSGITGGLSNGLSGITGGSGGLSGITGGSGALSGLTGGGTSASSDTPGQSKVPGRGGNKADSDLGISENSIDENEYEQAYKTLFMYLPSESEVGEDKFSIVKSIYRSKREEYKQDVFVETYLVSRLNEFYLNEVEKTLNNVDECILGNKQGEDCVFFGMQIVYSDPSFDGGDGQESEGEGEGEEEGGKQGDYMNSYIVTTIYDRLLRIVEDLTTMEAIYRAAAQLDYAEPIKESNASKYIEQNYQFAYVNSQEHSNAKMFGLGKLGKGLCEKTKSPFCPFINKTPRKTNAGDNSEILSKLSPVGDLIEEARLIHNIKYELPEYNTEYRKYLKSVEVHKRALDGLSQSDNCVISFIERHKKDPNESGKAIWLGSDDWDRFYQINNHEKRKGLSRELIIRYQEDATDKFIGTTSDCRGYYEEGACPDGYVSDKNNACENDSSLFACSVETITADMESGLNGHQSVSVDSEDSVDTEDMHTSDGFINMSDSEKIENENRKKGENKWRLGHNIIMENLDKFKFDKWVDQQALQKEYLFNKYRNIRMVINSIDLADASYRIAKSQTAKYSDKQSYDDEKEPIQKLVNKLTSLKTPQEAVNDGSAITYAKSKGLCSSYNKYDATKKQYTKEVVASWRERVVKGHKIKSVEKYSKMELACYAVASSDANFVDIKYEEYIEGTKRKDTKTLKNEIDLRIRNSKDSYINKYGQNYVTKFYKEPKDIQNLINSGSEGTTESCAGTWNFTVNFLVRKFFPTVLGRCGGSTDAQARNMYSFGQSKGRIIALDKLEDVKTKRVKENKKITKVINNYLNNKTAAENKKEKIAKNRKSWSKTVDSLTTKKNDIISRLSKSKSMVEKLGKDNDMLEDSNKKLQKEILKGRLGVIQDINGNNRKISLNKFNIDRITKSSQQENSLCTKLESGRLGKKICIKEDTESEKYITIDYANSKIKSYGSQIKSYDSLLKSSRDDLLKLEERLKQLAEKFAEDYVDVAEEAQDNIEKSNKKFEEFVEYSDDDDVKRMKGKRGSHTTNDLSSTILLVLENRRKIDSSTKLSDSDFIKESIESTWFTNSKLTSLGNNFKNSLGLPDKIYISERLDIGDGKYLDPSLYSANKIIEKVKDNIIKIATARIADKIEDADKIAASEVEKANDIVNNWAENKLCVLGEGGEHIPGGCSIDYMDMTLYGDNDENAKITMGHKKMINDIITPKAANKQKLSEAGIDLRKVFGVIDDSLITTDTEYFASIPARGLFKQASFDHCVYGQDANKHDGCDYKAPKAPLANIPPLREAFYFSSVDYDNIPSKKAVSDAIPAISVLLEEKYPGEDIEILPEVWRYLLARPNLRNDGKYQQTFTERSYDSTRLLKYLDKFDEDEVHVTINRAGVYPCKIGNTIVDVEDADKVGNLDYIKNNVLAGTVNNNCYDVSLSNQYIKHNLSDYNSNKSISKNKNKGYIKEFKKAQNRPIYKNISELTQFVKKHNKKIAYRRPIHTSGKRLTSKDTKNNIENQMALSIMYTNNVMGRFLNVLDMENNTRKNMNQSRLSIEEKVKQLCSTIHENDLVVSDIEQELEGDEKTQACLDHIMDTNGLASNSSDKKEVKESICNRSSTKKSTYETIFCTLNTAKAQKLNEAKKALANALDGLKRKEKNMVKDRIEELESLIKALEADSNEELEIKPGDGADVVTKEAIYKSAIDRKASLEMVEEALVAMDNQSKVAPYCPVY